MKKYTSGSCILSLILCKSLRYFLLVVKFCHHPKEVRKMPRGVSQAKYDLSSSTLLSITPTAMAVAKRGMVESESEMRNLTTAIFLVLFDGIR